MLIKFERCLTTEFTDVNRIRFSAVHGPVSFSHQRRGFPEFRKGLLKPLGSAHEPFGRFVFKGLMAKSNTGSFAGTASDAFIGIQIYSCSVLLNSMNGAHPESIAIFAVMFTDNIEHCNLLTLF
jgi:hypothetical protein